MHDEWHRLCAAADLTVRPGRVRVHFPGGRSHDVHVRGTDSGYLVTATVATWDVIGQLSNPNRAAWKRNRRSRLVGFRITAEGTLLAHGWTPEDGLTADAFQLLIRAVAREADRYEYQLTGTDRR